MFYNHKSITFNYVTKFYSKIICLNKNNNMSQIILNITFPNISIRFDRSTEAAAKFNKIRLPS